MRGAPRVYGEFTATQQSSMPPAPARQLVRAEWLVVIERKRSAPGGWFHSGRKGGYGGCWERYLRLPYLGVNPDCMVLGFATGWTFSFQQARTRC